MLNDLSCASVERKKLRKSVELGREKTFHLIGNLSLCNKAGCVFVRSGHICLVFLGKMLISFDLQFQLLLLLDYKKSSVLL